MTRKIVFTDIKAHPTGEIVLQADGTLKGSTPGLQQMADAYLDSEGGTAEDFLTRFTHWSNGYSWSRYVEDDTAEKAE